MAYQKLITNNRMAPLAHVPHSWVERALRMHGIALEMDGNAYYVCTTNVLRSNDSSREPESSH